MVGIKQKLALALYRQVKKNTQKIHTLNQLFWECTLCCNLNCLHCGSDCQQDALTPDMPLADFLKVLDDIRPMVDPHKTLLILTGGEPLMRKDLAQCGKAFYERGFPWGMVSNGLALTPKRLQELLQSGLRSITISFDGLEATHNWMRGNKNSYVKAREAIAMLAKVPDLAFDVVTCVNQKNLDELPALKAELLQLGVREWRLFTVFPVGRAKEHTELDLNPKAFKQVFDFIARERELGELDVRYGCEGFLGPYEMKVREKPFFCRAGITTGSVLVDGSIAACPNLRENFIQGNIYRDSFREVWESRYQEMRDRSWAKTGICRDCKDFKNCEGNALHLRTGLNKEVAFCHLKRLQEGAALE